MKRIRNNIHILLVVENNQVPMDTRVWKEAQALREKGFNVSVICPNKNKDKNYKKLGEVEIHQYYNPFIKGTSILSILGEYLFTIFPLLFYSLKIYIKKPFSIIHIANPPDFLVILFLPFKLFGIKIVFDHHDLSPELFIEKFGEKNFFFKLLLICEKLSYKLADVIITTNNSIKDTCIKRNKVSKNKVFVIRNGPDLNEIKNLYRVKDNLRRGKKYLIGYVGNIDSQDSLEKLVASIEYIVKERKFDDFRVLIIGDGNYRTKIEDIVQQKSLQEYFIFYGSEYNRKKLFSLLSKIDIGVEPSRETEKFSKSTSTKVMEYMALGKPVIQYNSLEGIFTAGKASLFIKNNDERNFGDAIIYLLKDKKRRKEMGEYGKRRVKKVLQWNIEKEKLLNLYTEKLLNIKIN
ncbi:MAG: glycosyltransferase family 4 protein [candidate division WOR-3 bacterium]